MNTDDFSICPMIGKVLTFDKSRHKCRGPDDQNQLSKGNVRPSSTTTMVNANGVGYRWPTRPVVVVCIDGGDPAYFDRGIEDGIIPNIGCFIGNGFSALAEGTMP